MGCAWIVGKQEVIPVPPRLQEGCRAYVALHFSLGGPDDDLELRAGTGHVHGIKLPMIQATADQGVVLAESPGLRSNPCPKGNKSSARSRSSHSS